MPTFEPAGPPFDAKAVMAGKSILSIPGTGSDPFYVQMNKGMKFAADAVGYPFTVWNNQGQLTQYQQGFANGITKKVSLIDLLAGPDPNALKPQITEAQDAGILVVSSHLSGLEQEVPNVDYNLPIDYNKAGRLLADWVITKDTKAHVLVVVSDEIVSTGVHEGRHQLGVRHLRRSGHPVQLRQRPDPRVGHEDQAGRPVGHRGGPRAHLHHLHLRQHVAVRHAGHRRHELGRQVKVIGFNGTPFVLDLVREGKVEMDIGESLNWAGMAIADAEMRLIGDMGLVESMNIPFRLFTKDNAAEAGVPAEFSKGYGDFRSEYAKLWGL